MRLIDADAMKQHYPIMENDFGMVFNESLHKELDGEPTVKAIPIAKIEKKFELIISDLQSLRGCTCSCSDGIIDDVEDIIDKAIKEIANG